MENIICKLKGIWRSIPQWIQCNFSISGHDLVDIDEHKNCTVTVSECEHCGKLDISWTKMNHE